MSLRKGSQVWIEDKDVAWTSAEIVGFIGKQVQVVTASGKKVRFGFLQHYSMMD